MECLSGTDSCRIQPAGECSRGFREFEHDSRACKSFAATDFSESVLARAIGSAGGSEPMVRQRVRIRFASKTICAGSVTAIWCGPGSVCCAAPACRWA